MCQLLSALGTPCLVHQPAYNLFNRSIERGLLDVLDEEGMGCVVFSPLAQGLLTDRYLHGVPEDSRAAKTHGFLQRSDISDSKLQTIHKLNEIARARGQTLAQLAVAWVLHRPGVTSAILGASRVDQIEDVAATLDRLELAEEELRAIDTLTAVRR